MNDATYDELVKRRKAVEWLMKNDSAFCAAMETCNKSPAVTALVIATHGHWITARIKEVASRMEVSLEDRDGVVKLMDIVLGENMLRRDNVRSN